MIFIHYTFFCLHVEYYWCLLLVMVVLVPKVPVAAIVSYHIKNCSATSIDNSKWSESRKNAYYICSTLASLFWFQRCNNVHHFNYGPYGTFAIPVYMCMHGKMGRKKKHLWSGAISISYHLATKYLFPFCVFIHSVDTVCPYLSHIVADPIVGNRKK